MRPRDPHEVDAEMDLQQLRRQEWGRWKAISERKYPTKFLAKPIGARADKGRGSNDER